jgi:hypothetical protein
MARLPENMAEPFVDCVTQHWATNQDKRTIAIWRSCAADSTRQGPVAIVASGFARQMRHMAAVARYLTRNGFVVFRCDYLDHVGHSDGEIWDFTMTGMYESLAALVEFISQREQAESIVVVAASLASRPAFRLAACDRRVAGVVGLVGVVNVQYTLQRVFGLDPATPLSEIPPDHYVDFERKRMSSLHFCTDIQTQGWLDAEGTRTDLARARCPITNFCGSSDDWVKVAEVRDVLGAAGGSRNPVAGQALMSQVSRTALAYAGMTAREPHEPNFEELAAQVLYERDLAERMCIYQ